MLYSRASSTLFAPSDEATSALKVNVLTGIASAFMAYLDAVTPAFVKPPENLIL